MTDKTIAVIGAGVIGCSWSAYYSHKGYRVKVSDVQEGYQDRAEARVRVLVGEIPHANVDEALGRITFCSSLDEAVDGCDVVQENSPEIAELKGKLFADLERAAPGNALLVSSSSGIPPEVLGAKMQSPERAMIGHPFNPAHLLPVVEICAAETAPRLQVKQLEDFYRECGRVTAILKKPISGFVINRLQAALVREAIHIVDEGVVDVCELDDLVMASLGVRWASVGPFLTGQLGGGEQGFRGITEHILASLFASMGLPEVSKATLVTMDEQTCAKYPMAKIDAFAKSRDARQLDILDSQERHPLPTQE